LPRRVFLPSGWRESDPAVLDAALWHELAHVARRDYTVGVAARLVVSFFWFHPIAWLAASRLRWFAELACDDAATRIVGTDPYTRALLAIGRSAARHPALALGASSQLVRRLDLLIDPKRRSTGALALACAFAALLVVPCSIAVRLSPSGSPTPAGPSVSDHAALHAQRHAAVHHH
jgi:beta-lactamase regulating signal transducer with metallopeptidase domain